MIARLAFIAAHVAHHSIRLLCRVLGVSRSWFHAWQRTAPEGAARAARHEALIEEIKSIFDESKQRYGAHRVHAELRDRGHRVSRKLVAKLPFVVVLRKRLSGEAGKRREFARPGESGACP